MKLNEITLEDEYGTVTIRPDVITVSHAKAGGVRIFRNDVYGRAYLWSYLNSFDVHIPNLGEMCLKCRKGIF